jgi:hypothetical protein
LLLTAYVWIVVRFWRQGTERALVLACLATAFAFFFLGTRVHERYLFPVLALSALVVGVTPRLWWLYVGLSATYLVDLLWVYEYWFPPTAPPLFDQLLTSGPFLHAMPIVNAILLGWVLLGARRFLDVRMPPALAGGASPRGRERGQRRSG